MRYDVPPSRLVGQTLSLLHKATTCSFILKLHGILCRRKPFCRTHRTNDISTVAGDMLCLEYMGAMKIQPAVPKTSIS